MISLCVQNEKWGQPVKQAGNKIGVSTTVTYSGGLQSLNERLKDGAFSC